jgi:hypothetical protein
LPNSRPSGLGITLPLIGILAVIAANLLLWLVPILECPECEGGTIGIFKSVDAQTGRRIFRCSTCEGKNRITAWKKWILQRNDPPR